MPQRVVKAESLPKVKDNARRVGDATCKQQTQRTWRESFGKWPNLKIVLVALFGATAGQGVVWYTGQFYALFYLQTILNVHDTSANYIVAAALLLAACLAGLAALVSALTKVYREKTDERGFCALGTVKANIGHLGAAAGVAGFIKTVLALERRQIPPSRRFCTRSGRKSRRRRSTWRRPFRGGTTCSTRSVKRSVPTRSLLRMAAMVITAASSDAWAATSSTARLKQVGSENRGARITGKRSGSNTSVPVTNP